MSILAGSTLGGGTVVNYMNCIRTPQPIREEWAAMGVEGDRRARLRASHRQHLEAPVGQRAGDHPEPTHQKLIAACEHLGYPHRPLTRNADVACEDPSVCGYCFAGCQKGASSRR